MSDEAMRRFEEKCDNLEFGVLVSKKSRLSRLWGRVRKLFKRAK